MTSCCTSCNVPLVADVNSIIDEPYCPSCHKRFPTGLGTVKLLKSSNGIRDFCDLCGFEVKLHNEQGYKRFVCTYCYSVYFCDGRRDYVFAAADLKGLRESREAFTAWHTRNRNAAMDRFGPKDQMDKPECTTGGTGPSGTVTGRTSGTKDAPSNCDPNDKYKCPFCGKKEGKLVMLRSGSWVHEGCVDLAGLDIRTLGGGKYTPDMAIEDMVAQMQNGTIPSLLSKLTLQDIHDAQKEGVHKAVQMLLGDIHSLGPIPSIPDIARLLPDTEALIAKTKGTKDDEEKAGDILDKIERAVWVELGLIDSPNCFIANPAKDRLTSESVSRMLKLVKDAPKDKAAQAQLDRIEQIIWKGVGFVVDPADKDARKVLKNRVNDRLLELTFQAAREDAEKAWALELTFQAAREDAEKAWAAGKTDVDVNKALLAALDSLMGE